MQWDVISHFVCACNMTAIFEYVFLAIEESQLNLYVNRLMDEVKLLCLNLLHIYKEETYDIYIKKNFQMKVVLM